ncbi:ABC transporter permease subunit [Sporosalibacterium faouarense]|uniref:ABC transporter permease subunit n=1 Tax=Sporosalibacterium faouarense TaxID=516123 RepID=UPI00141D3E5F|nr:ABC transporter permease subunit [Sporosalibacterium faouarense]MTI47502.1 ABC transporter permease [Bacillota bacterium]
MNSFKAYLLKEFKEGIRSYKFLIIGVAIIIFAILDPIMLKLLPRILASQSNIALPLDEFIKVSQGAALQNYLKDINQIINIVIIFSLMGILSDEAKEKMLVFPYSKGASKAGIVLGKFTNYAIAISVFLTFGFMINYYYAGVLFPDSFINFRVVLVVVGLSSIYFIFNISLIILLSSVFKKGIWAGMSSIGIIFLLPLLGKILPIKRYLPSYLIDQCNKILALNNITFDYNVLTTILGITIYVIILNVTSIWVMNGKEIA